MLTASASGLVIGWAAARFYLVRSTKFTESGMTFGCAFVEVDTRRSTIRASSYLPTLIGSKKVITKLADLKKCLTAESVGLIDEALEKAMAHEPVESFVVKTLTQSFVECIPQKESAEGHSMTLLMHDVTSRQRNQLMMQNESEAMKEEVRRYSAILNNARAPLWIRDQDMVIQYCNLSYTKAVEDLSGHGDELGVPELHQNVRKLAKKAHDTGEEQTERMHIIIDGKRKLFNVREVHVPEMNLNLGFAYDISELEEAEEQVNSYKSAQDDLMESASSAIAIYGSDMRLKSYNHSYVRMWGYDEAWLDTGPTFSEVLELLREKRRLPEQANFQAYKQQRLALFTNILEPTEEIHFLPDGRTIRSIAIPHALGGVLLSYEDVTDRLALERSYNTLIAVQRETLDNLHEGVIVFGEDGRIRLTNPALRKIWELKDEDVTEGVHISDTMEQIKHLLPEQNWEEYKKSFIEKTQSRSLMASRRERSDGKVVDWSMVPLPDGGTLLTYIDVTDSMLVERSLREKNEALQAADRLKTEFLANVSYELRSPLTSISGFSEMLRQNYFGELTETQSEYIEGIHESAQHLSHLINDILDLASIEAGYLTLEISEFNLRDMFSVMISLLQERMKEFKLHAEIECDDAVGIIKGDETRIRQVIFHLLSNAVKYSKSGGEIRIGAAREKEHIRMWVADDGIGIEESEQDSIFEKFYRGQAGSVKSGTGLGLSMVKNFIQLHGGKVLLDSAPGKGTTVTCLIPLNPPVTEDEKAMINEAMQVQKETTETS